MSLGFAVATLVFFAFNFAPRRRGFVVGYALVAASEAASLMLLNRTGALNTMKNNGGGNMAFPLVLSPQDILLLSLLMVAFCGAWGTLRTRRFNHPLLYLCLVAGSLAPAAFGRSDPGHIIVNMLGALLCGFIVLMPHRTAWRWATASFFVLFLLLGSVVHLYNARGIVLNAMFQAISRGGTSDGWLRRVYVAGMLKATGPEKTRAKLAALNDASKEEPAERLHELVAALGPMWAPFGYRAYSFDAPGDGVEVLSGRYSGLLPMLNAAQPIEKIAELKAHPSSPLLVPNNIEAGCEYDPAAERKMMMHLLTPIYLPPMIHRVTAGEALCSYITAHYAKKPDVPSTLGFSVWVPVR